MRPMLTVGLCLVLGLAGCSPSSSVATSSASAPAQIAKAAPEWQNRDAKDEMHGSVVIRRSLMSTDTFDSVISGDPLETRLTVQRQGKNERVYIENKNLQFTCDPFSRTYVEIKFDSQSAERFPCTAESTQAYGFAFLDHEAKFVRKLKSAKTMIIQADVFQRGSVLIHFTVPPIDW